MDVSSFAELLKPFPILQLFVVGVAFFFTIVATLRGAKENKRDAHLAPANHDPLGLTVIANSMLGALSGANAGISQLNERFRSIEENLEEIARNQRDTTVALKHMTDNHTREMSFLRETLARR